MSTSSGFKELVEVYKDIAGRDPWVEDDYGGHWCFFCCANRESLELGPLPLGAVSTRFGLELPSDVLAAVNESGQILRAHPHAKEHYDGCLWGKAKLRVKELSSAD